MALRIAASLALAGGAIAAGPLLAPILGTIGATALGAVLAFGAARLASGTEDETNEFINNGVPINTVSTVADIPIVYGYRRVGGPQALRDTGGSNNKFLYIVQIISEGPIQSVDYVYFDGRDVIQEFNCTTSDGFYYEGDDVKFRIHLGTDDQAADPFLVNEVTSWTSAHRLRGVAYIAFRLRFDVNEYPTGRPIIEAEGWMKQCFDPRTALMVATKNPIIQLRDYHISTRYGRRIEATDIDDASVAAEADYCDELIPFPDGTSKPRYESNAYLTGKDGLRSNVLKLATAARAYVIYSGGLWSFVVDKPEAVQQFEFDESNIIGEWQIELGGKNNRYNEVKARIQADEARKWQPNIWTEAPAEFLAEDNGQVNSTTLELPCTTSLTRAQMIAKQELAQSRQSIKATFVATSAALLAKVGKVYNVTHSTPGWNKKPFRLMRQERQPNGEIQCQVQEYDPSVHDLSSVVPEPEIPDTDLPNPFFVAPVTNLTAITGNATLLVAGDGTIQARILADWDEPDDGFVARYRIQWRKNLEGGWQSFTLPQNETEVYLQPVQDGALYDIQVRAESINQNVSAWRTVSVVAKGKDEPPPDVPSFSVSEAASGQRIYEWTYNDEEVLDLLGFVIRYGTSGTRDWDAMIPLHTGVLTTQPYYAELPFSGSWAFAIRAIDRSRNLSTNPRFIDATLLQETGTFLFRAQPWAQGFPGTLTGCRGSGTALTAVSRGNWGQVGTWTNFEGRWVVNPEPSISYQYALPGGGEIDLGSAQNGVPFSNGEVPGDATLVAFEYATSTDGANWTAWASTTGAAATSARYWRFRVRVDAPFAYVRNYLIAVERA